MRGGVKATRRSHKPGNPGSSPGPASKSRYTLIPLTQEALDDAGIPLSVWTLRDWRKYGRHPEIFVKLGRRVFLVLEKWNALIEKKINSRR